MNVPVLKIERVILSHWHSDHTGGLLSLLKLRGSESAPSPPQSGIIVDVHPDRPIARGIAAGPNFDRIIGQLPADPAFEMIKEAGGQIEFHSEGHAVADGTVWVSGEIPRLTDFEQGLLGGKRFYEDGAGKGGWVTENVLLTYIHLIFCFPTTINI
jgi:7,8-dihydropterin-6-yl-methyl-4-(beta-D-ribofuranosyl)aminobenzene 5'-phosphate synthase